MKRRRGFTLVELNLAMVFVSILLIAVALLTIQITRMYQKGVTVKTINQIGREVNDQLRTDITAARPSNIRSFFPPDGKSGRLCLGSVSYVYNTAAALKETSHIKNSNGESVYLARIVDDSGAWCNDGSPSSPGPVQNTLSAAEEYTELLVNDDTSPLAIHDLALVTHEPDSSADGVTQRLFQLSMLIGTNEAETVDGGKCLPPTASEANFDYCFVAEFETIIRSGEVET